MSKHTPGPWEYVRETEYMGGYPCNVSHKVKVGQELLTVGCHGYGWGEPEKEIEANAHLVAAAPEMYEALRWLLHLAHDVSKAGPDFPVTEEEWADAWESAKAALERAERGDGEAGIGEGERKC